MRDYYKYLPISKEDESWGLTVLNAGRTHIGASREYPFKTHPEHHNFNWNSGRILQEYQIIYITRGQGVFESAHQKEIPVKAGSILLLFPHEKHRYKPDDETGWDEYWIGIKGEIIQQLQASGHIRPENACLTIGLQTGIVNLFNEIIETAQLEQPGYQPLISGAALHLLGTIHAVARQHSLAKDEDSIILRAQLLFRANVHHPYSPEKAAAELNVGYSWFRKQFKSHTGMSPGQYYLQLKIEEARNLLMTGGVSVKEIAGRLNFDSVFYFSKLFKAKTGLSPTDFQARNGQAG